MEHEDYLECPEYEGKSAHPSEPGFSVFFNDKTKLHYFALLDADGKVLLRSEGYPQEASRDKGLVSVKKNRTNRAQYDVVRWEAGGYILALRALNDFRIAVSCPCDSEADALALLPYVTGEKIRTSKSASAVAGRSEDDYLVSSEYRGHPLAGAGYPGLAAFTHKNRKHYFAWYDQNENILMRSEGYPTENARAKGMASVIANREIEERYSIEEARGLYFAVLRAGNRQEIARSLPLGSEAAALMLFPSRRHQVAAAASVVPPPPPVPTSRSKSWLLWLLLIPILVLIIWALWPKASQKVESEAVSAAAGKPTAPVPVPVKEPQRDTLHSILFDYGKAELNPEAKIELDKMAAILKGHPETTGLLHGHADAISASEFNDALSLRRATAAKDYLIASGIEASRLSAEAMGEQQPVAKNIHQGQDSYEGRQFNRRVELFVKGGDEKVIEVESVPPDVPEHLQAE